MTGSRPRTWSGETWHVRFHPVVQLWASKIHDLANMGISGRGRVRRSLRMVQEGKRREKADRQFFQNGRSVITHYRPEIEHIHLSVFVHKPM